MERAGGLIRRLLAVGVIGLFCVGVAGSVSAADSVPALPAVPGEVTEGMDALPALDTEQAVETSATERAAEAPAASVSKSEDTAAIWGLNPVALAFLALFGLFFVAWLGVTIAKAAGVVRAWTVVGVPILLIGGLGVAYAMNQVKPSADTVADICTPTTPPTTTPGTKSAYFLAQVHHVQGASMSRVVKLTGEEVLQKARSLVSEYKESPGSSLFALKGRFLTKQDPLNPSSIWSWDEATYDLSTQRDDPTKASACSGTQRPELREFKPVSTAAVTDYCPFAYFLTDEIGETLPAIKHTVSVSDIRWSYTGIPGVNMKLDTAGAEALKSGKLMILAFNPSLNQYIRITDPAYVFHAGEGYLFAGYKTGNMTVQLDGVVPQTEWLKLSKGWNFVSFPHNTKRTVDRVKTVGNPIGVPAKEAVEKKVLDRLVYTYGWENNQYKLYMPKTPAELSATTMPGEHAFWFYAYEDAIVTFK